MFLRIRRYAHLNFDKNGDITLYDSLTHKSVELKKIKYFQERDKRNRNVCIYLFYDRTITFKITGNHDQCNL